MSTSTVTAAPAGVRRTKPAIGPISMGRILDTGGTTPRLVLVGGGDPLLAREPNSTPTGATYDPRRADVRTLAKRTARNLKASGVTSVELGFDDSLFAGPAVHPTWKPDYIPEEINPVSALWVDEGRALPGQGPVADPALEAWWAQRMHADFDRLELELQARPFVAGDAPTIADISCCGYLFWTDQAGVDLAPWPALVAWLERIRSLPGWLAPYDLLVASPPIAAGTRT